MSSANLTRLGLYRGYIGIKEKKMETTTYDLGFSGARHSGVYGLQRGVYVEVSKSYGPLQTPIRCNPD